MKLLFVISCCLFSAASFSKDNICAQKSAIAVKKEFSSYFDKNAETGKKRKIEQVVCSPALRNTVKVCEVSASNGDGAGDLSFLVTLDSGCARVISVEMTGEE